MKRVEFTITGEDGKALHEPGFVDNCAELPVAIMRAVEDFLEVHGGRIDLPITIVVSSSSRGSTC